MGIYFLSLREEGTSLSFNEMEVQALFFTSQQRENLTGE